MDTHAWSRLRARIMAEVPRMLAEGDLPYLLTLDHAGLITALGDELRFLGLYTREDHEAPAAIRMLLCAHLSTWVAHFLRPRYEDRSDGAATVYVVRAPWVMPCTTAIQGTAP